MEKDYKGAYLIVATTGFMPNDFWRDILAEVRAFQIRDVVMTNMEFPTFKEASRYINVTLSVEAYQDPFPQYFSFAAGVVQPGYSHLEGYGKNQLYILDHVNALLYCSDEELEGAEFTFWLNHFTPSTWIALFALNVIILHLYDWKLFTVISIIMRQELILRQWKLFSVFLMAGSLLVNTFYESSVSSTLIVPPKEKVVKNFVELVRDKGYKIMWPDNDAVSANGTIVNKLIRNKPDNIFAVRLFNESGIPDLMHSHLFLYPAHFHWKQIIELLPHSRLGKTVDISEVKNGEWIYRYEHQKRYKGTSFRIVGSFRYTAEKRVFYLYGRTRHLMFRVLSKFFQAGIIQFFYKLELTEGLQTALRNSEMEKHASEQPYKLQLNHWKLGSIFVIWILLSLVCSIVFLFENRFLLSKFLCFALHTCKNVYYKISCFLSDVRAIIQAVLQWVTLYCTQHSTTEVQLFR